MRLECFCELFCHGLMQPSMEIHASIHTERFHSLESLNTRLQRPRRVQPANIFGSVHLDSLEPLRQTLFRSISNITWSVASNPGVHVHAIADFASQQLPDWHVEFPRFQIPKSDVDAGESGHEYRAAAVERFAPGVLPEGFDVVGFVADEAGDVAVESAFDGFCVALWMFV
jgi:hypothetical protein